MTTQDNTRLGHLVLARLATSADGLQHWKLRRQTYPVVKTRLSQGEWRTTLSAAVLRLEKAGAIRTVERRLQLTPSGRAILTKALGVSEIRAKSRWSDLSKLLAAQSLGQLPAGVLGSAESLRVALVARQQGVSLASVRSEAQLRDALLAKILGMDPKQPLTRRSMQRYLLAPLLQSKTPIDPDQLIKLLAARAVGARHGSAAALLDAALGNYLWARGDTAPPQRTTSSSFAEQVLEIARSTPSDARFGDNKVFISEIWSRLSKGANRPDWSEPTFKQLLTEANRRGELRLVRADLVEVMNPRQVAASETRFENATFHFVRL